MTTEFQAHLSELLKAHGVDWYVVCHHEVLARRIVEYLELEKGIVEHRRNLGHKVECPKTAAPAAG